jgi:hypothetical protein
MLFQGHSNTHTYAYCTTPRSHITSSVHISRTGPGALCSDICKDDVIPRVARSLGAPAPLPARLHLALALGRMLCKLQCTFVPNICKVFNQPEYYGLYLPYVMIILWYSTLHFDWSLPGKAGMARWAGLGIVQYVTPRCPMRYGWSEGRIVLVRYCARLRLDEMRRGLNYIRARCRYGNYGTD